MTNLSAFGNHERQVTSKWESIPPNSPLIKRYRAVLWARVSESAEEATSKDMGPQCEGKKVTIYWNPVQLERHDGELVSYNDLSAREKALLASSARSKVYQICQGHLLQRMADDQLAKENLSENQKKALEQVELMASKVTGDIR